MKDTTIVITAFDRVNLLAKCVKSIRRYYPEIPIIISDNGKQLSSTRQVCQFYQCAHIRLPYNCGANQARREGLENVGSKYAVLIEDDMEFIEKTKLENFKSILDEDNSIGLIGGAVLTKGHYGAIGSNLKVDYEKGIFWRDRIEEPTELQNLFTSNGTIYFYCDYVRMFFMKRREMEIDWEVGLYPSSGSHQSIMLKLLDSPWKKAWTWGVEIDHAKARPTKAYAKIRADYRKVARKIFVNFTGLRYGIFNGGERVEDILKGKKITLMELARRLNDASMGKAIH